MSINQSFNSSVTNFLTKKVEEFVKIIGSTYDVDANELMDIWLNKSTKKGDTSSTQTESTENVSIDAELSESKLLKLKKVELQDICRKNGKKSTGTKAQLVGYILDREVSPEPKKTRVKPQTKEEKSFSTPVVTTLLKNIQAINVREKSVW